MRALRFFSMLLATGFAASALAGSSAVVSVSPNHTIIQPGRASTCMDYQNSARGRELKQSATGPLAIFNNFTLAWSSDNELAISQIRVKLTGKGILGGSQTIVLSSDEVRALLGLSSLVVTQPGMYSSSDTNRPATYPPCALVVGGIALVDGDRTPSFRAMADVELIGTVINRSTGNAELIRIKTLATVEHIAY